MVKGILTIYNFTKEICMKKISILQPKYDKKLYILPANNRSVFNFNIDWKFIRQDVSRAEQISFDDSFWETISVPHTFNDVDSFDEWISNQGEANLYKGIVWYRKHFKLDSSYSERKIFIEFEGIRQAAFVYVNGVFVGQYEAGVTPFGFDVTDSLKFGIEDNVIAVKCDNTARYSEESTNVEYQWSGIIGNPNYGGLTRNIRLYVMNKAHMTLPLYRNLKTTGTYIYPSNISTQNRTAVINIESQVKNDDSISKTLSFQAVIVDMEGNEVKTIIGDTFTIPSSSVHTFTAKGDLADVKLWQIDYPYLYKAYCILKDETTVLDAYPITTGFRKVDFVGGVENGGVYINNKQIFLCGYAQRASNEWAGLGAALPDWMHDFDGQLVKESNANLIRWMHISAEPVDIRTCDKYGIVAIQPAGDAEANTTGRQWEHRVEVMNDNIIYFRNSPSILFWEVGNNWVSAEHMTEMRALKYKLDPSGMRAIGCRAISDDPAFGGSECVDQAEYVGTMLNRHYSDYARDRMPIIESEYTRDEAPRRVWDDFSAPDFDYKRDASATWDYNSEQFATISAVPGFMEFWKDRVQGPGNNMYSGCAALCWSDSNQHGRQYLTENCRMSGRVDAVRLPKESFYTFRIMQSQKPDINVVGHWNYPVGTVKTIYVVASNVSKVELFINDVSRGVSLEPSTPDFLYAFPDVTWKEGIIKAVGYGENNIILCQCEKETSENPAAIKLKCVTGPTGLLANGEDIVIIDIEVVDSKGRRCPTDQARIDFTISGTGKFEGGWNSGKQYSVHQSYVDTECGINRVFIRSTRKEGTIKLTATREGLKAASIEVTSSPVNGVNGLNTEMPSAIIPVLPSIIPVYGTDFISSKSVMTSESKLNLTTGQCTLESGNIGLNKLVFSDGEKPGYTSANINDGNLSTLWCAADGDINHWCTVDLGSTYDIHGTEVTLGQNGVVYKFKIEVSSDNTNWTLKIDKTHSTSVEQTQKDTFTATARYVRITVTGLEKDTWASLYQFKVIGDN